MGKIQRLEFSNDLQIKTVFREIQSMNKTIIQENDGTIDKYIGDAIMAFGGAPRDMDNHAYNACQRHYGV